MTGFATTPLHSVSRPIAIAVWALVLAGSALARPLDLPVRLAGRPEPAAPAYLGDRLSVRLKPWAARTVPLVRAAREPLGLAGPDGVARALGGAWFEPEFKGETPPPAGSDRADFSAFYLVHLPAGADLAQALDRFTSLAEVESAEPIAVAPVTAIPNDSLWAISDWFYHPPSRRDLHAPEAWDITTGDTAIVVAIVDTGLMPYHPEFAGTAPGSRGQLWINWAEQSGLPGVDDDHNGFVDDVWGWDFVDLPPGSEVRPGEDGFDAEGDPNDFVGHGTAVAGIVGAIANNGSGIAGTVWKTRLMALRVGYASVQQPSGEVSMSFAAQAIRYATRMGARVINCSFSNVPSYELEVAISDATAAGVLVVFGSGNYGSPNAVGPRADVLTVGAVDRDDIVAPWSNNAPWVDLCAPGTSVATTAIRRPGTDSLGVRQPGYVPDAGGTSFSAPFVTGAAALVQAQRLALGLPLLDPLTLVLHLRDTADDISDQNPTISGFGAGRLDLERAVARAGAPASRVLRTPGRIVGAPVALPRAGGNWIAMVTDRGRLLILDDATGATVRDVALPGLPVAGLAAADLGRGYGVAMFVPLTGGRVAGFYPGGDPLPGWPVVERTNPAGFTKGIALGDLDGDGALEVVGAAPGSVQAWRPDGQVLFRWSATEVVSASVALADLDGQPGLEVIVPTKGRTVYAVRANGTVLPGWPAFLTGGSLYGSAAPVVTRFGHETSPTIVVADGSYLHALRADGSLRFRVPLWDYEAKDPALADLNGDGSDEVVVASGSDLAAFDSTGTIVWTPRPPYRPYAQDVPAVGMLRGGTEPAVILRVDKELNAYDRSGRLMTGFPRPGMGGPYPVIANRTGGVAAELLAATDGDSLLFLHDLGPGTWSAVTQPWPTARGNSARTGSHIGDAVITPSDTVPPARVTDLGASTSGLGIEFTWTSPADAGVPGHASSYEMRWSLLPIDEATFDQATPLVGTPVPSAAGRLEHLRLPGFEEGRTYYFALRSHDSGWNVSRLSNVVSVSLPQSPPARVGDLRSRVERDSTVTLEWTASGDDSMSGRPQRYQLRGDTHPFDQAGFATAPIRVAAPAILDAGGAERFTVTGLPIAQPLWFAIEAEDDLGLQAPISNVASVPLPVVRPARISDLRVYQVSDGGIELHWTAVGDDSLQGQPARYLLRASPTTLDSLGFDAAPLQRELASSIIPGQTEHYLLTGLAPGQPLSIALEAEDDLGLRSGFSNVINTTFHGVPPATVSDLRVESVVDSGVVLSWSESGDDGTVGRASRYLLAADTTTLGAGSFDAAPFRLDFPRGAPGRQQARFSGLPLGHTVLLALEAVDDIGARSTLSNIIVVPIGLVRPAPVADLRVLSHTDTTVTLGWTATGDDSVLGRVTRYHLRASYDPIDASSFGAAPFASEVRAVSDPGRPEVGRLEHLPARTLLYVALEAEDDARSRSALSNVLSIEISPRPPGAIADLAVVSASENGITFRWTASGDDGTVGQAEDYLLRGSPVPITAANFGSAPIAMDVPASVASGGIERARLTQVSVGETRWYAIKARDHAGALAALSNVIPVTVRFVPPAPVADLRAVAEGDSSISLRWTATGDDGQAGRPAYYELRAAQAPIDEAGFDLVPLVMRVDAASDAGGEERFVFPHLTPGRRWWIALEAVDAAGTRSTISNVPTTRTHIGGPLEGRPGVGLAALHQPSRAPVQLYWQSDEGNEQAVHTVEIYDITGRRVQRLSAGPGVGGVIQWDARDANGERLPAGLYFARMADAASQTRTRILLLP